MKHHRLQEILWRIYLLGQLPLRRLRRHKHLPLTIHNKPYQKLIIAVLIHLHNRRLVSATVAVIRSRPHRNQIVVEHALVTLHRELVRTHDATQIVRFVKLPLNAHAQRHLQHLIHSEETTRAARRLVPALPTRTLFGIAPQQITHGSLVRHFLETVQRRYLRVRGDDHSHLTQGRNERGQTAVETENRVADKRSDREIVEQVRQQSPDFGRLVLAETLLVKTVHLRDLSALVVATQNVQTIGVAQLEGDNVQDGF